jgi:outer membrane receptor protein involved in Fe transport
VGAGEMRLSADYQFMEDHFTNLQNSELARSGDVKVLNASLGYEFADPRYSLALACRNCLDHEYISQSLDFSGIDPRQTALNPAAPNYNGLSFLTVYAGPPREWSLTFKAKF